MQQATEKARAEVAAQYPACQLVIYKQNEMRKDFIVLPRRFYDDASSCYVLYEYDAKWQQISRVGFLSPKKLPATNQDGNVWVHKPSLLAQPPDGVKVQVRYCFCVARKQITVLFLARRSLKLALGSCASAAGPCSGDGGEARTRGAFATLSLFRNRRYESDSSRSPRTSHTTGSLERPSQLRVFRFRATERTFSIVASKYHSHAQGPLAAMRGQTRAFFSFPCSCPPSFWSK
jgi:hypothetical protein